VRTGRLLRADYGLPPAKPIDYIIKPSSDEAAERLNADQASIVTSLRVGALTLDSSFDPPAAVPSAVSRLGTIYMPLDGVIDVDAERERLASQLEKIQASLTTATKKLENENYVNKAPEAVVAETRAKKKALLEESARINGLIDALM